MVKIEDLLYFSFFNTKFNVKKCKSFIYKCKIVNNN